MLRGITLIVNRGLAASLVALLVACSTYDRPVSVSTDPSSRRADLLQELGSYAEGDEIYVVLNDGSDFRARYRGHGEVELLAPPVLPGWRAVFTLGLARRQAVYPLSEIQYVARSRPAGPTKVVYAAVGVALLATFVSYFFVSD